MDATTASKPSTLPPSVPLSLRGFTAESDFTQRLVAQLTDTLQLLGSQIDLERLDGITVGYDFDAALASVDLGFESARARTYTRTASAICVAKAMNVLRDGEVMSHVVFNAHFIEALADPAHADYQEALHIVAHELGHVAELKLRDEAIPNLILRPWAGSALDGLLFETASAIWEEYAACRMTGRMGNQSAIRSNYAQTFDHAAPTALLEAYECIKAYRTAGDIDALLVSAGRALLNPLKFAGYLLGHLDGTEDATALLEACPSVGETIYPDLVQKMHADLRQLWDTRETWHGIEVFDGLIQTVIATFAAGGIYLIPEEGRYYVSVPLTSETVPDAAYE